MNRTFAKLLLIIALGAQAVELHTGRYADAADDAARARELAALTFAGSTVVMLGMALHAGHGLNYQNVGPVAMLEGMMELILEQKFSAKQARESEYRSDESSVNETIVKKVKSLKG